MTVKREKILVFGIAFFYPLAGVTYQFLHYLLGLKRLGYDVYYIEDSTTWLYDIATDEWVEDASCNVSRIAPVLEKHGFAGKWCHRAGPGGKTFGMSESELQELYSTAAAFLNVTGGTEINEDQLRVPLRVYVESDPFASQVRVRHGDQTIIGNLDKHNRHFTFGELIHTDGCGIPQTNYNWLPTRQAVAVDLWESTPAGGSTYNTLTTWHNNTKPVEWEGSLYYWTKDREFENYLDLPGLRTNARFELATKTDEPTRSRLNGLGWHLADSHAHSCDVDTYRKYIQGSRAEFTVARDQYVRPRTGWFSDRSCCYLAAGRPVITQETGFSDVLPSGKGLFGFQCIDDVLTAIDAIESDYAGNCLAAKEIAREYFSAEKVIAAILERAGL